MNKKQTAVSWLIETMCNKHRGFKIYISANNDILNKAIQMERTQIEESYDEGEIRNFNKFFDGEQYYTKTYCNPCTPQS